MTMTDAAPRFTDYARESTGYHTISFRMNSAGDTWDLTMRRTEYGTHGAGPTITVVTTSTTPVESFDCGPTGMMRGVHILHPTREALRMAREILGTAYTVVNQGRGYLCEIN